ncbi:hypothetical protein ILUMI_23010 [Ignelater luminosus]|uniref:Uncharacterized protein n=1 Tax=Ignelater luminosus TaxID=2038154 RepID=A0A8K0CFG9_IGNLU|nr:hypothetical protein ILUMI_23010 [Ignelater luminosus]
MKQKLLHRRDPLTGMKKMRDRSVDNIILHSILVKTKNGTDQLGLSLRSFRNTKAPIHEATTQTCLEENGLPVFLNKFRRVLTEEYNITFKASKSDSCSTCDSIHVPLGDAKAKNAVPRIEPLNTKLDLHHRRAQTGHKAIENASKKLSETYAITFDLQQALPTPKLSTGPTFYKKNVFCYNFSKHSGGEAFPVSLTKKGRPIAFDASFMEDLPLKYDAPLEMELSKLEHVMSCLIWTPQAYHCYYESLKPKQK